MQDFNCFPIFPKSIIDPDAAPRDSTLSHAFELRACRILLFVADPKSYFQFRNPKTSLMLCKIVQMINSQRTNGEQSTHDFPPPPLQCTVCRTTPENHASCKSYAPSTLACWGTVDISVLDPSASCILLEWTLRHQFLFVCLQLGQHHHFLFVCLQFSHHHFQCPIAMSTGTVRHPELILPQWGSPHGCPH